MAGPIETFVRTALHVLESHAFNERPSCVFSLCFRSSAGEISEYGVFIYTKDDTPGMTHLAMMDWYDSDHWMMRDLRSGSVASEHIVYRKSIAEELGPRATSTLVRELFETLHMQPFYGEGLL